MKKQAGNILFLILLAVVLFAALAVAVTNSLRGGGKDMSDENAASLAAVLDQEASRMKAAIMRLELVDGYQVLFNTSAPTTSGTCYNGDVAVTPCKTIGLFNSSAGVNPPVVDDKLKDPRYTPPTASWMSQYWRWEIKRVTINGIDVGTSAPDVFIAANVIPQKVCEAINKNVNGNTTIGIRDTSGSGTYPMMFYGGVPPSFTIMYVNQPPQLDLANAGCTKTNTGYSVYQATYLIKEN